METSNQKIFCKMGNREIPTRECTPAKSDSACQQCKHLKAKSREKSGSNKRDIVFVNLKTRAKESLNAILVFLDNYQGGLYPAAREIDILANRFNEFVSCTRDPDGLDEAFFRIKKGSLPKETIAIENRDFDLCLIMFVLNIILRIPPIQTAKMITAQIKKGSPNWFFYLQICLILDSLTAMNRPQQVPWYAFKNRKGNNILEISPGTLRDIYFKKYGRQFDTETLRNQIKQIPSQDIRTLLSVFPIEGLPEKARRFLSDQSK